MRNIIPVLTVVGLLIVVWYGAAVALNAQWARDVAARADKTLTFSELVTFFITVVSHSSAPT